MPRPTQAGLDLAALRHNCAIARKLAPHSQIMAVVKANAYGHGALPIARQLEPLVDALAVASIEEAVTLRDAGLSCPILLLEGVFAAGELPLAAALGLLITIATETQLRWLEEAVLAAPVQCWLKLDTGMHRLGIAPARVRSVYERILSCGNALAEPVLYTHFVAADDLANPCTARQIAQFEALCEGLPARRSAANSAGVLAWPHAHYDWIRPGYMLYGNSPFAQPHANAAELLPVMTLRSAVIDLHDVPAGDAVGYGCGWYAQRPSRIATVTVGYGDGYPRGAANGTPVLVNGQRVPLAGRVSMDMITVDVTDIGPVKPGDEVILWGKDLPVDEVAGHAGTIGYELTTRMPARTPRVVWRE